jgi:hypothetical protein
MRTERTELRRLLEHLYARGFRVSGIDDGPGRRDDRIEGLPLGETDEIALALALAVTAVDSSTLFVQRSGIQGEGSIDLVLGNANDGSEIVSDYGWRIGHQPDKFSDAMRDFDISYPAVQRGFRGSSRLDS